MNIETIPIKLLKNIFQIKLKNKKDIYNIIMKNNKINMNTTLDISNTKKGLLEYAVYNKINIPTNIKKKKKEELLNFLLLNKKEDNIVELKFIENDTKNEENDIEINLENYKDILLYIFNNDIDIKDMIIKIDNKKTKGRGLESLFNSLYFLYCKEEKNEEQICDGNFNTGEIYENKNINKYMERKICRGSDISDLTLIKNNTIIVLSSKHYTKYSVDCFDISDIEMVFNKYKDTVYKNNKLEIRLLVDDKKKVLDTLKYSKETSKYLSERITDMKIYDIEYIQNMFNKLKIKYNGYLNINDLYELYNNKEKERMKLRFGQYLITEQTKNIVEKSYIENGKFRIINGSVCRFGKSYCIAKDILNINNLIEEKKIEIKERYPKFLFITTEPKTINKIIKIFKEYNEFKIFNLFKLYNDTDQKEYKNFLKNKSKPIIIFTSIQTIRNKSETYINTIKPDVCLLDEFHKEGLGEESDKIMEIIGKNNFIFYSGTFSKIRSKYEIQNDDIVMWTLQDNIDCKFIHIQENLNNLFDKYSETLVKNILKKFTINEIKEYYENIPTFSFIIRNPSNLCIDFFHTQNNETLENKDVGYSFSSVKMLKKLGDKYELRDKDAVVNWFQNTFFGYTKKVGDEYMKLNYNCMYDIYLQSCLDNKQRITYLENKKEYPLIIPIYIGRGLVDGEKLEDNKNSYIYETCKLIKETILKEYFKFSKNIDDYEFIIHTSSKSDLIASSEDIEDGFDKIVHINKNKKAIFLLLGESLTTGITNKYCDLLCLTDSFQGNIDKENNDRFIQTIFRTFNETNKEHNGYKKYSYIMLDNFQSSNLSSVIQQFRKKNETDKQTWTRILSQQLINICKYDNHNKYILTDIKDFEYIYSETKFTLSFDNQIDSLIDNIKFNLGLLEDNELVSLLSTDIFKSSKTDTEQSDKVKKGIKTEQKSKDNDDASSKSSINSDMDAKHVYKQYKDNVKCLFSLLILLSLETNNIKFQDILSYLETTNKQELLFNQLSIQLNKTYDKTKKLIFRLYKIFTKNKYLLERLEEDFFYIRSKFIDDNGDNNIIKRYENILSVVKTTSIEKKQNAEILTPLSLAIDMINKVPFDFWSSNLPVFDPCCGKGVFTILLYNKLMDGLESKIQDKKERRKYILENLIYFSDINEFNIYITKFLLDPFSEYKLKYNIGDTLTIDIKEKWDIEGYGLVIGNPPYQEQKKSGDNKLYLRFTSYMLKNLLEKSYLLFITPKNILDYLSCINKNRKYLSDMYKILYLEIDTPKKYFNVGSNFCIFLLQNIIVDKCETTIKFLDIKNIEKNIQYTIYKNKEIPKNIFSDTFDNIQKKIFTYNEDELFGFKVMKDINNKEVRIRKQQITNGKVSLEYTDKYKYKIINNLNPSSKKAVKTCFYFVEMEDYKNKKLIISKLGYLYPTYSINEGLSDNLMYINIENKEEVDKFKKIIDSKLFKLLRKKYLNSGMDEWKLLLKLKKINLNNNIYEEYKLTKEEINFIENNI